MFDLNDIRYFLAVAQAGNLSAAARQLGVTQPTVGRHVRAMEDALEAHLFDRTRSGYTLTLAGKDILKAAESIEENAWVISNKISGEERKLSGKVRLTTSEGLASTWIMDKLPVFRDLHPSIELEILAGTSLADLLRREADVALRTGTTGSDELVGQCLGQVGFGLYASHIYIRKHGEPNTLEKLVGHNVVESVGEIANLAQARKLRSVAKESAISLFTNNLATLTQATVNGVGIAPLPHYVVNGNSTLKRILVNDFDIRLDLWLLTHRDLRFTARVRVVREFLKNQVQQESLLLSGSKIA